MQFKEFLGNRDLVARFLRAAQGAFVPPALLLAGPEGVGKKAFALAAAQYLNCRSAREDDSCGRCLSCFKIAQAIHPDVRLVVADGNQIKIEQTRQLSADVQFRPFEGKRKVYILDEAERLNEFAANSILKTLEEVPAYAWIVLVTAHPDALLPTIRSRCQVYWFAPVAAPEIEILLKQRGLEEQKARVLSRLSNGSIGRALTQDWDRFTAERNRALTLLGNLAKPESFHAVHDFWTRLPKDERGRQALEELLEMLLVLLRDLLMIKEGRPAEIAHLDILTQLERGAAVYSFERIVELEAQIRSALRELKRNVNPQILLESLYFERSTGLP